MALSTLELNTIRRGAQMARLVIDQLKPVIDELNVIYDADDGVKEIVDQEALDTEPSLSGLTKAQLDDGMYALTATLKTTIGNAYTQLVHLAARSQ